MVEVYDFIDFRKRREAQKPDRSPGYEASFHGHPTNRKKDKTMEPSHEATSIRRMFDEVDDWLINDFCSTWVNESFSEQDRELLIKEAIQIHDAKSKLPIEEKIEFSQRHRTMLYSVFGSRFKAKENEIAQLSYAKSMSEVVVAEMLDTRRHEPTKEVRRRHGEFEKWQSQTIQHLNASKSRINKIPTGLYTTDDIINFIEHQRPSEYYAYFRPIRYISYRSRETTIEYAITETHLPTIRQSTKGNLRERMIQASGEGMASRIANRKDKNNILVGLADTIPFTRDEIEAFERQWLCVPYASPKDKQ